MPMMEMTPYSQEQMTIMQMEATGTTNYTDRMEMTDQKVDQALTSSIVAPNLTHSGGL